MFLAELGTAAGRLSLGAALYAAGLAYEKWKPLRPATQPKLRRLLRNLAMGVLGSAVLRLGFYAWLLTLAQQTVDSGWGLLSWLNPTGGLRQALGFLALDYSLYAWHAANHYVPFLWRFHNPHHVDLDMDISTAARFHVGELVLSVGPRALQIVAFGLDPLSILIFDAAALAAVHFHHSNIRLPAGLDRALSRIVVTPRMHGIHHSIVRQENRSNFSTVFSFWDRAHGTLRLNVPDSDLVIGVPAYRDPGELTLAKSLLLPFQAQRPWRLPDGRVPERPAAPDR